MIKKISMGIATLSFIGLLAAELAKAEDTLRLSAANSLRESIFKGLDEPFLKETGIKLVYNQREHLRKQYPSLTIVYFKDVIEGSADAAVASSSYEEWAKLVQKEKIDIPSDITHRVIGRDYMLVAANKDCGVTSLSLDQVEKLFVGAIKNWKELGGANHPVTILHAAEKTGLRTAFGKLIMKGKDYGANSMDFKTVDELRKKMATMPGALTYDTSSPKEADIIEIKTPPIGRPATLITKGRPSAKVEKFVNFIRVKSAQ